MQSVSGTDLFVMAGSDSNRPGLLPSANYSAGIGHTCLPKERQDRRRAHRQLHLRERRLPRLPLHGLRRTYRGPRRNEEFCATPHYSPHGYTWLQGGITSYTGNAHLQSRVASSAILGINVHLGSHNCIWFQESYNEVVTVPWYTTASIAAMFTASKPSIRRRYKKLRFRAIGTRVHACVDLGPPLV